MSCPCTIRRDQSVGLAQIIVRSSDQAVPHVEGRSLRSASTGSSFSLFSSTSTEQPSNDAQGDDVLVMYLYDNRDPVWIENFKFFVQWGIAPKDGCSYIILVSEAMYAVKVSSSHHEGGSSSMICMQTLSFAGQDALFEALTV